ncbi:MAG: hypothetical protein IT460_02490 [Planctomycetes bacterium]|nr:hypothetical protein [Planctomycetota bacterium]
MGPSGRRVGLAGRRVATAAVLLALCGVVLRSARVDAADAPRWESRTTGIAVRGLSSLRIVSKTPEIWYASIYGSKTQPMGLCESRDKGKTWKPLRQGLEELVTSRDAFEITVDPKDEKTLYVVTRGKVFKSTNAGQSFESIAAGTQTFSIDRSQSRSWVAGVAVDPSNSKRLLAGTRADGYYGGLFESKDAGRTWSQIAGTGDRKDLQESGLSHDAWPIALDKTDKFVLVGGRTVSALLSEDRGLRFKMTQPGGAGRHEAHSMTPMHNGEVFLAESRGLWRSRDRGATWGKEPLLPGVCLAVDVEPGNRKAVWAVIEGQGLWHTDNLTKWAGPGQGAIDPHDVVVHPSSKNTVFLTSLTTGLWMSTDHGETWQTLSDKLPDAVPAVTHAAVHPADPKQALAVTDTGFVFASQDGGATWTRPGNLGASVTRVVGVPGAAGTWLVAGAGVAVSKDFGSTWQRTLVSPDAEDRVVDLERLPDGTWLALWEREARLSTSKDGGATWENGTMGRPTPGRATFAADVAVDPKDPKHLLLATRSVAEPGTKDDRDGGPYESRDGGTTWTLLDAGLKGDRNVWRERWNQGAAAAIDPSGALLYAVHGVGVFRLEPAADGKGAWAEVTVAGAPALPTVTTFATVPTADGGVEHVMQLEGLTTRALVRSGDGGKTWSVMPDPGTTLASLSADPTTPGRLWTGDPVGDRGVLVYEVPGAAPPPAPAPSPAPAAPPAPAPAPTPAPDRREKPVAGLMAFTAGADKAMRIYDLHAGVATPVVGAHDGAVTSVLLSRDESRLFTGSADKTVRLWKGDDGSALGKLEGHAGAVGALAVSPDGAVLYAGDEDWKILVWDVTTGKPTGRLEGHTHGVTALALDKTGARLYSASRDRSVRAWDTAKAKEAYLIGGHPGEVLALALSPDGTRLYTGGRDGTVRVFETTEGKPAGTYAVHQHVVTALALAPDGATLYVAGDTGEVESVATADGKAGLSYEAGAEGGVASLAVSADGRWVVGGGADGVLRLWRAGTVKPMWASAKDHAGAIFSVALTPDQGEPLAGAPGAPPEPAMGGDAPPAMGETPPAMGEAPPAMGDAPPAMGETPPAMGEAPPAMGETPPAMGDAPPAMGDTPPAMGETPPAMG